ncbi:MAG TPA: ATP-dependent DNA helicase [Candidatus Paceibacterota bacterium]|nr:ATP-dependent DNA helicase [Candidatus Paceibacterota bacterium]
MVTSPKFQETYKNLNKRQKEAVDTIDGPVMVIAGPGTGKTTILTLRIANILNLTDTPAHGILAITYTDAGVRAMREKLQELIGDRAYEVRLHTFHSFASSIISEYPDHFLHLMGVKQLTEVEQEALIRQILAEPKFASLRPTGKPDVYLSSIIRTIDDAKREAVTPNMIREHAKTEIERLQNDESSLSTRGATKGQLKAEIKDSIEKAERTIIFADIYELYEKAKMESKKMDFNDLIIELLSAFQKDELLLRLIQEKYLYIHVDEHQDTNDAQNLIIGLLAEFFETPNIFIVGDEKQAIYRFQGASVENFFLLQRRWPAMSVISLDTNYRSHQSILDASWSMIEKNYEGEEHVDLRIALKSGNKEIPEPLEIVTGENTAAMELELVERLRRLSQEEVTQTAAIIVRRNRDLDRIIRLLEFHRIPVSSERSVDIFNHPAGRIFFDLLEYLADNSKIENLASTLVTGLWNLSFEETHTLLRNMRAGISTDLLAKIPALKTIAERLVSVGPLEFLIYTAEISGFANLVAKDPVSVSVWRGIVALAESLVREGRIADPRSLIKELLSYRTSAESRMVKISVGMPEMPIKAMTAHGSKGLEFDYVFLPYATDQSWIGRPKGASFLLPRKRTTDSDVGDIRRLFYVALTRARKHVVLMTALAEADDTPLSPLRFIEELNSKHVVKKVLPQIGIEKVFSPNRNSLESRTADKIVDLAKRTLIERGLSVTALNHFMECPNKFLYLSILKMPEPPTAASEKGNAIHEALARAWQANQRNEEEIIKILTNSINEYFERSFLGLQEKIPAKNELLENVPVVAKALGPHFEVPVGSRILTEWRIENKFDSSYENQSINIPLHGKLDVIVDTGSEALIYDYKSRRSMSVSEIRGETKNSDGNYFRQLIYYKLLTTNHADWKSKTITPALVFVTPDDKGRCPIISLEIKDSDLERVRGEVESLLKNVWSGEIAEATCPDEKCQWCGLRRFNLKQ